ncbi:MAG: hypothetical protein KatS3mg062_0683 [Tepidiforma sp.]|nr:MAG: hypothetical protein KatS3mg062_0683 [Tepidiforma sp.]
MTRLEKACPFTAATRASHCERCWTAHGGVPPCVAAYLGGQGPAEGVVRLEVPGRKSARKAA